MIEPPLGPSADAAEPENGRAGGVGKHPVDAAARGAHRDPPTPRRASAWLIWGMRALLVVPTWCVVVTTVGLARGPRDPLLSVLVAAAAAALLLVVMNLWWVAGRPRLDTTQQTQLVSDLRRHFGHDAQRRLHRVLWRGGPVPAELRPWAEPFLLSALSGPQINLLGVTMSGSSILLSTSHRQPLTPIDVAFVVLVLAFELVMLGGIGMAWRARRGIRRERATTPATAGEEVP